MNRIALLSATLGLAHPWEMIEVTLSTEHSKRLDMAIDFAGGSIIHCPVCGAVATVCGVGEETWFHRSFFQHAAYIHARVPHVRCPDHCGTVRVPVPWSRSGSSFVRISPGDEE